METAAPAAPASPQGQDPKRLVLKNTAVLLLGQLVGMPLNVAVTVLMANYLGPDFYGALYIVSTMTAFGNLFIDFGQGPVISGLIPRDRSRAGELLGSSMVWRTGACLVVYGILSTWIALEHSRPPLAQTLLMLLMVQGLIQTYTNSSLEAIRGLERTDISAYQNVLQPLLTLLFMALVLKGLHLGGRAALTAQNAVYALILVYVWRARRQVGIHPLTFRWQTLKAFFRPGFAFLIFNLAMQLQPIVDAKMLQYLHVPLDVVGWNAAARRLVGPLVVPASVLVGALYPTLSRLHSEDHGAFLSTVRSAVRGTLILSFPIGLGCALYGGVGVMLFGAKFAGATTNLVFLSPYVFCMYFSMPLGIAILASQRQRVWAAVQSICVLVSLVGDPLLIPWFQHRYANGGLGVCVTSSISELFMVAGGVLLTPRGTFDRGFFLSLVRCLAAGAAMAAVAFLLRHFSVHLLLSAPLALAAYVGVLWAVGGLGGEQMDALLGGIKKKLRRR